MSSTQIVAAAAGFSSSFGDRTDLAIGADRIDAAVRAVASAGVIIPGQRVLGMAGHPIEGGPRLPTIRLVKVGDGGTSTEP